MIQQKSGLKIMGINAELDTRSAVPLSVAYLTERHGWPDSGESALLLGANTWLNLTPTEFVTAFEEPSNVATPYMSGFEAGVGDVSLTGTDVVTVPPGLDHPHREENESSGIRLSGIREFDPDVMERASRSHRVAQNLLARLLREHELTPISPTEPPRFDIGWCRGDAFSIAEVKSPRARNESHQIRLGLGQVLGYLHQLLRRGVNARAVLAVQAAPASDHWADLWSDRGVLLTWAHSPTSRCRNRARLPRILCGLRSPRRYDS